MVTLSHDAIAIGSTILFSAANMATTLNRSDNTITKIPGGNSHRNFIS
jgi:hypothetical protein